MIRTIALTLGTLLYVSGSPAAEYDIGENPPYASAILVEAYSGTILYEHNPHLQRSPASTQKLLLQLVVMGMIDAGKFSLDETVTVSAWAVRRSSCGRAKPFCWKS